MDAALQFNDPQVLTTIAVSFGVVAFASFMWSFFGKRRQSEAFGFGIFIGVLAIVLTVVTATQHTKIFRTACHTAGGIVLLDSAHNKFCVKTEDFIPINTEVER